MRRVHSYLVLAVVFALVTVSIAAAQAQAPAGRQGFGRTRGSFVGLLSLEQVQKGLKLSEDQIAKVKEIGEKLRTEMREQFAGLRDIQDMQERRAKMTELSNQSDQKARGQLREVLSREQMMRLFQIRLQVRGTLDALNNRWIAERLKLTDEQKKKAADLEKATQDKMFQAFSQMRDLSREERREKFTKMRNEAEEKALGVLTAEQKEALQKMKGQKLEL
jgi:Spy/CpxP family protein refolding chaperone